MTLPLIASIIGIALVDSLNPSLFIAQFYLLTTPRPTTRILSYIAGLLLVNYVGGLLILGGLRTVISEFVSGISPGTLLGGQIVLGLAILAFGLWFKAKPAELGEAQKPRSLQPIHTFVLGMGVMVNELTTALPYFVGLERIAAAQMPLLLNLLALLVYNLIFALPLFGFLALYLRLRDRFNAQIARITAWVGVWAPRFIKWASILFGLFLLVNAATQVV
jgi:cytochrome c biogenesis protein CcdA